jgi:hypothetical protein
MKNTSKNLALLAVSIMALALLGGCGGPEKADGPVKSDATPPGAAQVGVKTASPSGGAGGSAQSQSAKPDAQ